MQKGRFSSTHAERPPRETLPRTAVACSRPTGGRWTDCRTHRRYESHPPTRPRHAHRIGCQIHSLRRTKNSPGELAHYPKAQSTYTHLRKGQLNRHTRYRPATTTRNTAMNTATHCEKVSAEDETRPVITSTFSDSHDHTAHHGHVALLNRPRAVPAMV